MIVFCYLSVAILFTCDNSYTLDAIRLPIPMSVSDEKKSLLMNFNDIKYSELEVIIGERKTDEQFRQAYFLCVVMFCMPNIKDGTQSKAVGGYC